MKSNKRKFIIISAAAAILLAAAVLAAYFTLFTKPAREFYLQAEGKNFKKYSEQVKNTYKDFYNEQKPYMDNAYKVRYEIAADVNPGSDTPFGIPNAKAVFDIVRKCKLVADMNYRPAPKESLSRLSLLLEKAPLMDASVFTKGRQLGFTVPILLPDRYFTLNLDKIDEVYSRFQVPVRPKRVPKAVDIAQAVKYSDEEFDGVIREYGSFISSLISEDDVKFGKDVVVKVGSEDKKGREVIVTLDSGKAKELLQSITGRISGDSALLRLTYENYSDVISIFDEAGLFQGVRFLDENGYLKIGESAGKVISAMNIKKDVQGFSKAISRFGSRAEFPDGLKMTLVIDSSGNILDRKFSTTYSDGTGRYAVNIHSGSNDVKNDDFDNGFCTITLENDSPDGEKSVRQLGISTKIRRADKTDDKNGTVDINYIRRKSEKDEFFSRIRLDISGNTDDKTLKRSSVIKYDIRFGSGSAPADKLDGEINSLSWENDKRKIKDVNTLLSAKLDIPSMGISNTSVKLDIKKETQLGVNFELPEVRTADMVDLNSITDEQLTAVEEEINKSLAEFYLQNQPLVDALTGK